MFKIGDIVLTKENEEIYLKKGERCTITRILPKVGRVEVQSHEHTYGDGEWYTDLTNIKYDKVKDTKIARLIHKDNIKEIKDGFIFFKS